MSENPERTLVGAGTSSETYTIYAAGGLFTQHDLITNILIKDSVWRQSNGKFELVLPQSKEMRELDRLDLAAYIRNLDLVQVVKADLFLARFDGLELDAGTVVEFMVAKFLGKPTVILRCDSRRLGGVDLDDPYNLMVRNWPRTVEIHFNSLMKFIGRFAEEWNMKGNIDIFHTKIEAEYKIAVEGIDEIAHQLIQGFERVLEMKSPYPAEYQDLVYKAIRCTPGSGFEQLLSEEELEELVEKFRKTGTL